MKLYSLPLSPYAARVRGAVYAKDLPVEIVGPPPDWRSSPEFRALSPMGRIPVLVLDDGTAIPESAVIVEYLEDAYPEPSLRPRPAVALARIRVITQLAELYVMPAMMPLFFLFDAGTRDEAAITAQLAKLDDALSRLEPLLPAGAYASGDRLSTADLFLAPLRFALDGLMSFSGLSGLLDRHEAIAAYAEVARGDPVLGRVWHEMTEGLKAFMAARASGVVG
jgi:glutathione S-transferase